MILGGGGTGSGDGNTIPTTPVVGIKNENEPCNPPPNGDLNRDCILDNYEACLLNGNSQEVCACVGDSGNLFICAIVNCFGENQGNSQNTSGSFSTSALNISAQNIIPLYNYLIIQNQCSEEAKEFALAVIEAGPDAEVDWEENIIYDPSLMDFPCHKIVIEDAIGVCSPLTQAVLNAFEANDGTNLILKISNSIASNANTSVLPQYNPINHTCNITINFRESYVEATTNLSLARTAIHESLHAILVYMFEEGQLVDQNGMPIIGFENLVIAYINFLSGLPENMNISHHTLMSDFVDDIATSLSAYGVSQGYDYPFSYYRKLSWGGLMGTPTFEALYPQYLHPDDEILNPDNVNPQWLDILYTLLAEQDNSELTFNHPNGTIYEFIPKGTQPNETEPCN